MNELYDYIEKNGIEIHTELANALGHFKVLELKKGAVFQSEGKVANKIGFILHGKIRHYYNIDGKDVTRWVSLKNNFVTAFSSLLQQTPSLEILECIEDTNLLICSREKFFEIKNSFPEIAAFWTLAIEKELIGYEYRVFQLITTNSEERYLEYLRAYPEFAKEVPLKYLASMLGIEPRHLSRIRKKLKSQE